MKMPRIAMRRMMAPLLIGLLLLSPNAALAQIPTPGGGSTQGTLGAGGGIILGWTTKSASLLRETAVTLTNAQVLALTTTAVTIVPAPGANLITDVVGVSLIFNYTAAYTSGQAIKLWYGNRGSGSAASSSITAAGFLTGVSASTYVRVAGTPDNTTESSNTAIVIQALPGTAFGTGNAANTVTVRVIYRIIQAS